MSMILKEKTFSALNSAYRIRMPRIQRDYAQGRIRNPKASAVRAQFITALSKTLDVAANNPIQLDFIYGEVTVTKDGAKEFVPLDGQQRLTTLFLLHWLLSPQAVEVEFKEFVYEFRRPAMTFCENLRKVTKASIKQNHQSVSESLKCQPWFRIVWEKDQTVMGMLVMLDALSEMLDGLPTLPSGQTYWDRLCSIEMFQCLQTNADESNPQDDGLTDRIYLRMNARGLALTPFEIIKSQIESTLDETCALSTNWNLTSKEIKDNFDKQWLEFFFRVTGDDFDHTMTRIFALHFYLTCLSLARAKDETETKKALLGISEDPFVFSSFSPFKQILEWNTNTIASLFRLLQVISAHETGYVPAIYNGKSDTVEPLQISHPSWFMDAIIPSWDKNDQGKLYVYDFLRPKTNVQRVMVYAVTMFPFSCATPKTTEQSQFKQWMRVCWNIIENSYLEFSSAITLIQNLSEGALDIDEFLRTYTIDDHSYAKAQVEEEKTKVALFLDDAQQVSLAQIVTAEAHPLLRGRISVLLDSPSLFAPRYARLVELLAINETENNSAWSGQHTLLKALATKITPQDLNRNPFPTADTNVNWRSVIYMHRVALRLLLDDCRSPQEIVCDSPTELWKKRMLFDDDLWHIGKPDRKGICLIEGLPYLYQNRSYMTSAIPLNTSIPELWRKMFNHSNTDYPPLDDGNTVSVLLSSYSGMGYDLPAGWESIKAGRIYFRPKQLTVQMPDGYPVSHVTIYEAYPSVDHVALLSANEIWSEILNKCLQPKEVFSSTMTDDQIEAQNS